MKKGISLILVISLLVAMTSFFVSAYPASTLSASGNNYISLELDKYTAKVGDVIKAVVRINNISNFAGYQVNIKYDPSVLQAVNPDTKVPLDNNTMPKNGNLLINPEYGAVSGVLNNTDEGILNFGKAYTYINEYKAGYPEESGILAEIGFKVIKEQGNTSIKLANCESMPDSLTGTMLFDWNSELISNYTVVQPHVISISDSQQTPSPSKGKITIDWSKDTVSVGDTITASIKVDDIDKLAGYQLNIKYDPTLLEPVVSKTGIAYDNNTMPEDGTLLMNSSYGSVSAVSNSIEKGILNFGKSYTYLNDYKSSGVPEKSGTLAQITFKALKPIFSTGLIFEDSLTMPEGTNGTLVYNWDGNRIQGYDVISSNSIKIVDGGVVTPTNTPTTPTTTPTNIPTNTPTPTPTPTPTTTSTPTTTPVSNGSIEIELDKNTTKVGDTIKAVVKVENINYISGYQVNIKYDPTILQPINPDTGKAFAADTMPGKGTLIMNEDFGSVSVAVNDLSKGIINFSKTYTYLDDYRSTGIPEKTGTLGVINFKVLKAAKTSIEFEDSISMPTSISGTMIFDWNTNRITGYKVVQPEIIEISGSTEPTPVITPTPTDNPTDTSFIELKLDKNEAKVGDIVKASVNIKDIDNFAGYQVNIKYDPQVLQAVDLTTGRPLGESQMPNDGSILINAEYGVISAVLNNLDEGILNFGKTYSYLKDYKLSNNPEETGSIAQIGFKVLKEKDTFIGFENSITMPESISGTSLFNWNGEMISGYKVINPDVLKISGSTPSNGNISLELDKNNAAVGEIINATIKIDNIKNFAGYQVNIKYDPEVLKPINPITGDDFTTRTQLQNGSLLLNEDYMSTEIALHDLTKGTLNFSKSYIFIDDYKMSGTPEESGVIGVVGFKVLKKTSTKISFENTVKMPDSISGTLLFDWDGAQSLGYEVIQPDIINGNPVGSNYIALELDKNNADVGEIIKAAVKVNNIDNLAGYQVNIKYDPKVLQPINLQTGAAFTTRTGFANKELFTNSSYGPTEISLHNLTTGVLNFSNAYTFMEDYKQDGVAEESGVIGVIGFKVLKKESTSISFEDNVAMPGSVTGTLLFDWDGTQSLGYKVIQPNTINGDPVNTNYIALELDKNTANVGEIIKATVKVNNIDNLAGYQVNIKYDPKVLQPINLQTGAAFTTRTSFANKELFTNSSYGPTEISLHNLTTGVLNFSNAYTFMEDYKLDGVAEESGVIGVIGFKVLKKESTSISFEDNVAMPGSVTGTLLFDWNGTQSSGYEVIQPKKVN